MSNRERVYYRKDSINPRPYLSSNVVLQTTVDGLLLIVEHDILAIMPKQVCLHKCLIECCRGDVTRHAGAER